MITINRRWVRVFLTLMVLLGGIFWIDTPARAQGIQITAQDTVTAGTVVENDIVLRGPDVALDGEVLGDVLAVGSNVTVNGKVGGSLIAIGGNVTVNGSVAGTTYSIANALQLEEQANLDHNLYFIGLDLTTQPGSAVGRDLVVLSLGAEAEWNGWSANARHHRAVAAVPDVDGAGSTEKRVGAISPGTLFHHH